jgi:hypothetical protein
VTVVGVDERGATRVVLREPGSSGGHGAGR